MSNVLLFLSDEHNPRFSSPYGHPFIQTPNMEWLAQQGTIFENAYCPSPLCMPSRSSFMAGRWVHEIQTYSNCNVGMEEFRYPAYGQLLAEQGVHAVHVGKVDVYRPGKELGFSEMILPGDRPLPGDVNHQRKPSLAIRHGAAKRADGFGPRAKPFARDLAVVDAAVKWLLERAPQIRGPWVLAVNTVKPHFPHFVTPELWEMYPQGADLPEYGPDCVTANHPYARDLRAHFECDQFTEEQIRGLRRGYLGCVTFIDQQLGRLLDALRKIGQLEQTNVIYTSDHGEMLGKFGMWWKCSLYEDSVRIPLLAAGPDFSQGLRVKTPVSLLDLQASLFHCTEAERPSDWKGSPLQKVPVDDPERVVFAEYHGHGTRSGAFMIRQGRWKLIYYMEAPHQLFDLYEDPEELHNLSEKLPGKVAELEAELRRVCSPEKENERAHAFERAQLELIAQAKV
ncbi:MAG: sulfatase-like hydrolase/transferase [Anaerolineae bacterium]|nr:sulfatase-like hydrolase/transferase [Anaerolineae bacterium]